jgi:hypothetical protein
MNIASHEQQIRERAYAIWEGEGRPAGRADDHWRQAEAEIAHNAAGVSGKAMAAAAAQPGGTMVRAPKRAAAAAKKPDLASVSALPARSQRRSKA